MSRSGWPWVVGAVVVAMAVSALQFSDWETLNGPYLLDDRGTVRENPCIKPELPGSWERLWTYDYWGHNKLTDPQSHKSYRPITTLTYRWNYMVHGMETFGYRVTNVLLHCAVSGLAVLVVLRSKVRTHLVEALGAAIIFAVHPVHAEAVSNITGRAEVLMSLFYLMGFLCYTTAHVHQANGVWRPSTLLRFGVAYGFLMIFTVLSLLSKEHGITLPVLCAGWDAITASGLSARALPLGWSAGYSVEQRQRWWGWARRTLVLAVGTLAAAYWRLSLNGETMPHFIQEQNPAAHEKLRLTRGLSYSWLYFRNLGLLVFPHQLSPDWTGGAIPILHVENLASDWRVGPILAMYLCFLGWLVWISLKPRKDADDKEQKEANQAYERLKRDSVLMMAWLVIPFIMSMNILTVIGFVMADRVLYLSTLGWSMMLASLPRVLYTLLRVYVASGKPAGAGEEVKKDADKADDVDTGDKSDPPPPQPVEKEGSRPVSVPTWPSTAVGITVLLATSGYSYKCYYQNRNWSSEFALWESAYLVNPVGHLVMSEYGKSLANIGRYKEAIEVLTVAFKYTPDQLTIMGSLGLSYCYTGRCDMAGPMFEKGLTYSLTGKGLGDALNKDGDGPTPEKQASMAAIFYVGYSMCAPNLGLMGDYVMKALQTHPQSEFAHDHANKVNMYLQEAKKGGHDPYDVIIHNYEGEDGKRQMSFQVGEPGSGRAAQQQVAQEIAQKERRELGAGAGSATAASPAASKSPEIRAMKADRYKHANPQLNALLFKLEHMTIDI